MPAVREKQIPAQSESQRKAAALAYAIKTGQSDTKPRGAVKSMMSMSDEELRAFFHAKKERHQ
jgi:hypothetical protein